MTTAKAQAAQLLIAREATPGTAPASGWQTLQPNPGGIQAFHPDYVSVRRNPLSPFMTAEKGDHVGLNAAPTLVHDLNKGWLDIFGPGLLRSLAKVPGNKGVQAYYPTAVTSTGFTVASLGDLSNNLLFFVRGCPTAANNGIKLAAGTSTGTEIKCAGLTAEAITQGTVMIEPAGVQAPSTGDVQMNAAGHLISTTLDFTTLNLKVGHRVWFKLGSGSTEFGIMTGTAGLAYATVAATPTTNLCTLKWHGSAVSNGTITPGADAATGKTIRLYFGVLYKNVADGDADYIDEPSWAMELRDTGVGAANAAVFSVGLGAVMSKVSFAIGVESKVEATINFLARSIGAPLEVADRITGPSTAYPAIAMELFDTSSNDLLVHRIMNASAVAIAAVNSCTFSIDHGVTARKQLATFGAAGMIFGNINPMADMETFFEDAAVPRAITNNTELRYEAIWKNGQAGFSIDLPTITLRNGAKTYAENSPVMMAIGAPAHRDTSTNVVCLMNVAPYLP